ncbi:MAG: hypothetical protein K2J37_05640 [Ruminococcus sp.]|nr:hypothetical protein [Ruminococcus sp.]MDE6783821.1 hypothetical protein [Ruminococcus sp.]
MKLTEKMSYLQGLFEGLGIDDSTKEGKALVKMTEVMAEMTAYIEDLQSQVDELTELCDILDKDLGQVEEDVYNDCGECGICGGAEDDEDDEDYEEFNEEFDSDSDEYEEDNDEWDDWDDDDELYEVACPSCGDTILVDEGMIDEGSINCPNCGELLEFDYDDLTIEDFEESDESGSEENSED